jgi:hypothetical protein
VIDVSPPFNSFRASSIVISVTASAKIDSASGAALSAAWFMLATNSSTRAPCPSPRDTFSTVRRFCGTSILIASLSK